MGRAEVEISAVEEYMPAAMKVVGTEENQANHVKRHKKMSVDSG